jgi:drug/metabolite transporter (DMT)-like permease
VLNACGQLLFKGARAVDPTAPLTAVLLSPITWGALILYALSSLLWLWSLSRTALSYAYPILALTFPIVVGLAAVIFDEAISPLRWLGVGLIVAGVSLLAGNNSNHNPDVPA